MSQLWTRPENGKTVIQDGFWTPYLENIRNVMLPYTFRKFEEVGYMKNFSSVASKDGEKHIGPSFSDGLVLESMRGAFDFLGSKYDPELDDMLDRLVDLVCSAAQKDGFLCTMTVQNYPEKRWGVNGHIIHQHDLYDHGCLIEAAISQYLATGKKKMLTAAVKAANLICGYMGPGKKNVVPGHSLPEEAFVKLYRLFRDHRELDTFVDENGVKPEQYLKMAEFWYDMRGNHQDRPPNEGFTVKYNQDHLPFAEQTTAEGHAVRATLCYTGAAAVAYELGRQDFMKALNIIWENVTQKKLHISGGIGTRHDIEGFDEDYNLPNNAYLETCAAIGNMFWNGEMSLLKAEGKYYDYFEQSLYNNVLAAIGEDFIHYTYQNPLVSDGSFRRWEWHGCPCCPPMLLKIFSALNTYIYTCREGAVNVNMYIGSALETDDFKITQNEKCIRVDSRGKAMAVRIRIPNYAKGFVLTIDGKPVTFDMEDGYAVVTGVWTENVEIEVSFEEPVRRIFANPAVEADRGMVAFMRGPFLLCAEGIDNDGDVEFTVAEEPGLTVDRDSVIGMTEDGKIFRLIPYFRWCNRNSEPNDSKMAVSFKQAGMPDAEILDTKLNGALYGEL